MAGGKWVDVPGKGRRFLTTEGEYRYGDPNAPLAPAASAVKGFFGQLFNGPARFSPEQMRSLTAPGLGIPAVAAAGLSEAKTGSGYSLGGERQGPYVPDRIANAPIPLQLPAAERAYQSEKSSVAQQTAQDPLFKKYQVADLTKQYNAAKASKNFDEADRIGMQIWAQTNPALAAKVKANQTGYGAIQSAPGMGMPSPMSTAFDTAAAQPGATTPAVNYATAPSLMQTGAGLQSGFNPTLGPDIVNNAYSIKLDPTLISDKMSQLQLQALRQKYNQGLK